MPVRLQPVLPPCPARAGRAQRYGCEAAGGSRQRSKHGQFAEAQSAVWDHAGRSDMMATCYPIILRCCAIVALNSLLAFLAKKEGTGSQGDCSATGCHF